MPRPRTRTARLPDTVAETMSLLFTPAKLRDVLGLPTDDATYRAIRRGMNGARITPEEHDLLMSRWQQWAAGNLIQPVTVLPREE